MLLRGACFFYFSDCGGGDEVMWWLWWLMWSMGSLLLGKREGWRLVFLALLARVGEVGWKSTVRYGSEGKVVGFRGCYAGDV